MPAAASRDWQAATTPGVAAADPPLSFYEKIKPVFACGAGLFSDGYINNVIGSVNTTLARQYGATYTGSTAAKNVSSIAFAGTVVGQLFFGYLSDRWSRSNALLVSTIILVLFTALATGSYYKGEAAGMFAMLTAWRFFVGVGIGGEYPAGSVGCAESTGGLKSGSRNRWFILFTNSMIDWGFVIGAFVPYVVAAAAHDTYYETIWRTSLGIGVVFPMFLFYLRLKLKEPEEFQTENMKRNTPYLLAFKFYWARLLAVSLIWFIYNFSVYAFGIYSSSILSGIYSDGAPLTTVFGWNTVINLFYIPGTLIGAFVSDWLGPKYTLILGLSLQCIVGYIMAGVYAQISQNIAAFAVVYGIFLSLGEFGPGNNIGLLASKTCATGVRGRYYGIAAAAGKVGAFVGTWAAGGSDAVKSAQYPFWVAASLCVLSVAIAFFFIPNIEQDTIAQEDLRFRAYLESKGWDTSLLGAGSKVEDGSATMARFWTLDGLLQGAGIPARDRETQRLVGSVG
ncbi:MFS phospholipid transporter Git1 [Microdochium trichocladiopsis]|uniref:MFS phospholipid transporter Git1 n=1 Tax=Microdochium trichocladiopsis TaxID=1682393 RepID=A0A9P9BLL6_9PEZI|nr:MFS phospholipid transporter Git1 [Microdochium trichocladiopsis]KAH7025014.1 MFS phospholipid transporter Git1 [Microdochium trichocladiopsis]